MRTAVILSLLLGLAATQSTVAQRIERSQDLMGTRFRIVVDGGGDSLAASAAIEAAFKRVAGLEDVFSDMSPDSEVSKLAREGRLDASADLLLLLEEARAVHAATEGAFDITVGSLTRLWRRAIRRGTLPTEQEIARASRNAGWSHVERQGSEIRVSGGVRLDFGGIAKGFAADEALAVLRAKGFLVALVDAGGDISAGEAPPGGWTVALPSGAVESLENGSVATSGDVFRHVEVGGTRYSHVLDPATGIGMTDRRTVTVVAHSGALADALASAFTVLPLGHIQPIVEALRVSVYIQRSEGPPVEYHPTL